MAARLALDDVRISFLTRLTASLVSALVVLTPLLPAGPAWAYLSETGQWTPRDPWPHLAVHLALLRGDGPYHSKLLYYYGHEHEELFGGLWGWRPTSYDCSTFPGTSALTPLDFDVPGNGATLFCSGMATLADGKLFTAGGTQSGTEFGIRRAFTFDANASASQAWTELPSMAVNRWYPTNTLMADGKVLVTSGSDDQHIHFFGGRKGSDTAPTDNAIFRYGIGEGGRVDPAVRTSSTPVWPLPREGHSAVYVAGSTEGPTRVFGGKLADGEYSQEVWDMRRKPDAFGGDYDYHWTRIVPSGDLPSGRWRHAAVNTDEANAKMIAFGGITKDPQGQDVVSDQVWRFWYEGQVPPFGFKWAPVTITNLPSEPVPGPRTGHAAVWHASSRSLLMFGGRGNPNGAPSDGDVWQLAFAPDMTTANWTKLNVAGPGPRAEFAVAFAAPFWDANTRHMYLFGGETPTGKANDLWKLRVPDNSLSIAWEQIVPRGVAPSARSGHSLTPALGIGMLYLFGGSTTSGVPDDVVYIAKRSPHEPGNPWDWGVYTRHEAALTGHTATFQDGAIYQRKPEIYSPSSNSWTTLNAPRLQEWYPHVFTWKSDEVFVAGPDIASYKLSLTNPTWTQFPAGTTPNFRGGSAVMYGHGKVLRAGGKAANSNTITGQSYWSDLSLGAAATWNASQNEMLPRINHNLVILPNGKVLVVGGTASDSDPISTAEKRPEIWDPNGAGGQGQWQGLDILATQPTVRDYHSTAILLPDGRVLSASGDAEKLTNAKSAEIFCPPYLFNGNDPATRPVLVGATGRWRYGADVTFSVGAGTTIQSACLIHPAATTHGFDQAQRYVPLSLLTSSVRPDGVRQYFLNAPPDSFAAPPGDYLLFANNAAGVPSVARWVRVGSVQEGQADQVAPDELIFSTTFISCNEISPIFWTAPGDDGSTDTALDYDVRYSFAPITEANFPQATPLTGAGIPLLAGTVQTASGFSTLNPATMVYVAGRTRDKAGNFSPYTFAEFATLPSCEGGGGYGTSARRSRDEPAGTADEPAGAASSPGPELRELRAAALAAPSASTSVSSTRRLVGIHTGGESPGWTLFHRDFAGDDELLSGSLAQAVVQTQMVDEAWTAARSLAPPAGVVGLRSIGAGERIVFPAGTTLHSFETAPRGYACERAEHSRLGDLLASATAVSNLELTENDTLRLAFTPTDPSGSGPACFLRVRVPEGVGATSARRGTDRGGAGGSRGALC